jgi:hypothetical protein
MGWLDMTMQDVLNAISQQAASSTTDLLGTFKAWFPYVLGVVAVILVVRIVLNLVYQIVERVTGR